MGIKNAYVATDNRETNRGSESDPTQDDEGGQGLESTPRKTDRHEDGRYGQRIDGNTDDRTITCVGFSEIDRFASDVLRYHYPTIKNYGDIARIRWEEVEDFDLLVGGVPCQSWSIAGKREGFNDVRGTMWWEFCRALKEKRPRYFIAENVRGLLSHDKGNSFIKIAKELCACGYAIDFDVLNAKDFSVPQNRQRVFIVGKRIDTCQDDEII
jgi:DNA-cytosine methyltransferase